MLLVGALGLAVFAGCSDDDSSDSGGSETTSAETTSAATTVASDFQTQANAICSQGNADIQALFTDVGDPTTLEAAEKQSLFEQVISISRQQVTDIEALDIPSDVAEEVGGLFSEISSTIDDLDAGGADALFATESDPFAVYNSRLEALGLNDCVNPG